MLKKKKKNEDKSGKEKKRRKESKNKSIHPSFCATTLLGSPVHFRRTSYEQSRSRAIGLSALFFARLSQYRFPGMYVTLHDYVDWLHRRMLMRIFCPLPATNRRLYLDDRTTYTVYFGNGRPVGA